MFQKSVQVSAEPERACSNPRCMCLAEQSVQSSVFSIGDLCESKRGVVIMRSVL